ncbi:MAG: histidine kinase [Burkholderiales bacterium]|nr:histidine kinase [Burkholderiales bacterium]
MPDAPLPVHAGVSDRWAAFRRVVRLPTVAAVFYFALVFALSRVVSWKASAADVTGWLGLLAVFTRQSFISALSILLYAGLAEALLAGGGRSQRTAWAWRVLAVIAGSMVGGVLRYVVTYAPSFLSPFSWSWFAYTTSLWTLLGVCGYALLHLLRAERTGREQLAWARQAREVLAAQQMEAELSALQAQIEPHFLFNTLANVKRLYDVAPDRGRDMLGSLIAYLQTALPGMRSQRACLGDELERVRHYLAILQMRMGERLRFDIDAPAELMGAEMPPMVIATLVENAIQHGLSPLPEGGRLLVTVGLIADGRLSVEVRDDGRGFVGAGGSGVGLANTRARLQALYGAHAGLSLEAAEPRGVVARLVLPCRHVGAGAAAGEREPLVPRADTPAATHGPGMKAA